MAADEHQDWVDRALARSAWEPPPGFSGRVVARAMASRTALDPPRTLSRIGLWNTVHATLAGFQEAMRARIEGSVWVLTQYRELLVGR